MLPNALAYLEERIKDYGVQYRKTFYNPVRTFKMFLRQVVSNDRSCRKTINTERKMALQLGENVAQLNTGNYCRARKKLPLNLIKEMAITLGTEDHNRAPTNWLWYNRQVKVIDGTTINAPDTPDNQKKFPQPTSQEQGLGFPKIRLLGMLSYSTGSLLDLSINKYSGKGTGELSLLNDILSSINEDDIILGDAMFGTYFVLSELLRRGAHGLFPICGGRKDSKVSHVSGLKKDRIVKWNKPDKPCWLSQEVYDATPDTIEVRQVEIKPSKKTKMSLVTTLKDKKQHPSKDMSNLYKNRYNAIELPFRDIKVTMSMDELSCKSPDMLEKEIWMCMFGYNLVRSMISMSAKLFSALPKKIGFKNAISELVCFTNSIAMLSKDKAQKAYIFMLETIASVKVGFQKRKNQVRKNKKRKKSMEFLIEPKEIANKRLWSGA